VGRKKEFEQRETIFIKGEGKLFKGLLLPYEGEWVQNRGGGGGRATRLRILIKEILA